MERVGGSFDGDFGAGGGMDAWLGAKSPAANSNLDTGGAEFAGGASGAEFVGDNFGGQLHGLDFAMSAEFEGLVGEIIAALRGRGQSVSFAESCTAGMIAAAFCSVAGASDVFRGSVVSYANEIKRDFLGVSAEILAASGAVSAECVAAMARGAARVFGADLAVAASGIAGPGGGTEEKPVGTIFVGAAYRGRTRCLRLLLGGERQQNRAASVVCALRLAHSML